MLSCEFSSRMLVSESDCDRYLRKISCDGVMLSVLRASATCWILTDRSSLDSDAKLSSRFWMPLHSDSHSFQIASDSALNNRW